MDSKRYKGGLDLISFLFLLLFYVILYSVLFIHFLAYFSALDSLQAVRFPRKFNPNGPNNANEDTIFSWCFWCENRKRTFAEHQLGYRLCLVKSFGQMLAEARSRCSNRCQSGPRETAINRGSPTSFSPAAVHFSPQTGSRNFEPETPPFCEVNSAVEFLSKLKLRERPRFTQFPCPITRDSWPGGNQSPKDVTRVWTLELWGK